MTRLAGDARAWEGNILEPRVIHRGARLNVSNGDAQQALDTVLSLNESLIIQLHKLSVIKLSLLKMRRCTYE